MKQRLLQSTLIGRAQKLQHVQLGNGKPLRGLCPQTEPARTTHAVQRPSGKAQLPDLTTTANARLWRCAMMLSGSRCPQLQPLIATAMPWLSARTNSGKNARQAPPGIAFVLRSLFALRMNTKPLPRHQPLTVRAIRIRRVLKVNGSLPLQAATKTPSAAFLPRAMRHNGRTLRQQQYLIARVRTIHSVQPASLSLHHQALLLIANARIWLHAVKTNGRPLPERQHRIASASTTQLARSYNLSRIWPERTKTGIVQLLRYVPLANGNR
jgi:hypothetical protein